MAELNETKKAEAGDSGWKSWLKKIIKWRFNGEGGYDELLKKTYLQFMQI